MSINLPFSSHSSQTIAPEQQHINQTTSASSDLGTNITTPLGAQPLAVKPVYKKRNFPSASRPDGIINRSGAAAAEERTQKQQARENAAKSKGNIYDRKGKAHQTAQPEELDGQNAGKRKRVKAPKPPKPRRVPKPKPPPKPKVVRPPVIWKPHQQDPSQESTEQPSRSTEPLRSGISELNINNSGPGTIESLVKQQESHRERLAQLANRPLPVRELQTLVCTELEEEHETLKALGIMLHKELLKLQLEEGVMLNMLKISQGGILDVSDLERVKAHKRPSARQLEAYDRMNQRHYQKKLQTAKAARAAAMAVRAAMAAQWESVGGDAMDIQDEDMETEQTTGRGRGRSSRSRRDGVKAAKSIAENTTELDGGDGDDEGDDVEENRTDMEETDTEMSMPRYQAPGESYSFRPAISSSQQQEGSSSGRPEASSAPAFVSLEEIKRLVVKRAQKRTAEENMMEQEADDDDLYELEFDDEEDQPMEEQRGQDDDDEIDQHQELDEHEEGGGDDGGEGEEEEEGEEEDEGGEEYYSSNEDEDEDEEGPAGDNEEDEDAARLALQRMLSMYGGV
ncbi:hypothetical protein BGX23_011809 [Mortierella sp. AD031]|nr:hypothetical protein BGX23_011809 [Mortierella sp. AD031]